MNELTIRQRIKLNALVVQYAEVSEPASTVKLFNKVYGRTGSADSAFDAVRQSGHRLWQNRMRRQ